MAIVITDLLGQDSFSGSRAVINANTLTLKNAIEDLENNLGISVTSGNIDVHLASGGQILAKIVASDVIKLPSSGTASITLTGSTGNIVGNNLTLSSTMTAPVGIVNTSFTSNGGSVFNGTAVFNALTQIKDGLSTSRIDLGAVTTHTVFNSDAVLIFDSSTTITLAADPSLVDNHVITLVRKSTSGTCTIGSASTTLLGFTSGSATFTLGNYKSCITLQYNLASAKWMIIGSSNVTIV